VCGGGGWWGEGVGESGPFGYYDFFILRIKDIGGWSQAISDKGKIRCKIAGK